MGVRSLSRFGMTESATPHFIDALPIHTGEEVLPLPTELGLEI
jgi:hypothetical protein